MSTHVVLVDEADRALGTAPKLQAHAEGRLHRALSVFVFDSSGRLLLQRRTENKYHSGGLWSNTCCSHPFPEEDPAAAARRRLQEEMGFVCELTPLFEFTYREPVGPQLTEHEYDHVFVGVADGITIDPNPDEVAEWRWATVPALRTNVAEAPGQYTVWFRRLLNPVLADAAPARAAGPPLDAPDAE